MHPTAAYIKRNGEVDAWDNSAFRQAVKNTGKSQVILAGITTDVCACYRPHSLFPLIKLNFNLQAPSTLPSRFVKKATPCSPIRKPVVPSLRGLQMTQIVVWRMQASSSWVCSVSRWISCATGETSQAAPKFFPF